MPARACSTTTASVSCARGCSPRPPLALDPPLPALRARPAEPPSPSESPWRRARHEARAARRAGDRKELAARRALRRARQPPRRRPAPRAHDRRRRVPLPRARSPSAATRASAAPRWTRRRGSRSSWCAASSRSRSTCPTAPARCSSTCSTRGRGIPICSDQIDEAGGALLFLTPGDDQRSGERPGCAMTARPARGARR